MRPESTSVSFRPDISAVLSEFDDEKAAMSFIGMRAAPVWESAEAEGQYPIINREYFKKAANTKRTSSGAYNRILGEFGQGTFSTEEHGLEHPIDDRRRRKYATLFDAESAAARILRYQILLAHERRVAAAYVAAGFTNHNVSTAWSTVASATPINDVITGADAIQDACGIGREYLSLIIPRADYLELLQVTQIINKSLYVYNDSVIPAELQPQQLAAMLGIKEVIVARSAYDTKEEGIAESMTQIWTAGICYLCVLANAGDDLSIPSALRTILWVGDSPAMPVVETYRDDAVRADIVRVRDDTDEVLTGEADLFVYQLTNT